MKIKRWLLLVVMIGLVIGGVQIANASTSILRRLNLTALCSPDPNNYRVWKVSNPNSATVAFSYRVVGSSQHGTGTVSGRADTFFYTRTERYNVVQLFVNGVLQD